MACWDLLSNLSLSFSLSYPLFSFLVTACVYDFQGLRVPFPAAAGAGRVDHGRVQCQNQQEGVPFSKIYRVESWIIGSFIFEMIYDEDDYAFTYYLFAGWVEHAVAGAAVPGRPTGRRDRCSGAAAVEHHVLQYVGGHVAGGGR